MPKFIHSPAPYLDFSVLSFQLASSARLVAEKLRKSRRVAEGDLNVEICNSNFIIVSTIASSSLPGGGNGIVSGYVMGPNGIVRGDSAQNLVLDRDIGTRPGQFTYLRIDDSGATVGSDAFGHGMLFLKECDGFAIASNRSHLISILLKEIGIPLCLDLTATASLLISDNAFFSQQPSISSGLLSGTKTVSLDVEATLYLGKVKYTRSPYFEKMICSTDQYADLLEEGLNDVISNCASVLNDEAFSRFLLDLSGGKDSRMVLAAVMKVPGWRDKVLINSKDVPSNNDLQVSCGLANLLGLKFNDEIGGGAEPLSVEDNIAIWRSYFHGSYHRVGAAPWSNLGRRTENVTLSGGGGELLRPFWSSAFNLTSQINDMYSILNEISRPGAISIPQELREQVLQQVSSELESLPGKTAIEKLDAHYFFFRNRTHFGMRAFSTYHEHLTVFPLLSKALVAAGWRCSEDERGNLAIPRDFLRKLHPVLASLPFEGGKYLKWEGMPGPVEWLDEDRSQWDAAQGRLAKINAASRDGKKVLFSWRDWPSTLIKHIRAAYDGTPELSRVITEPDLDVILSGVQSNDRISLARGSVIMAAHDAVHP